MISQTCNCVADVHPRHIHPTNFSECCKPSRIRPSFSPLHPCDLLTLKLLCKDIVTEALQEQNKHRYSLFDGGQLQRCGRIGVDRCGQHSGPNMRNAQSGRGRCSNQRGQRRDRYDDDCGDQNKRGKGRNYDDDDECRNKKGRGGKYDDDDDDCKYKKKKIEKRGKYDDDDDDDRKNKKKKKGKGGKHDDDDDDDDPKSKKKKKGKGGKHDDDDDDDDRKNKKKKKGKGGKHDDDDDDDDPKSKKKKKGKGGKHDDDDDDDDRKKKKKKKGKGGKHDDDDDDDDDPKSKKGKKKGKGGKYGKYDRDSDDEDTRSRKGRKGKGRKYDYDEVDGRKGWKGKNDEDSGRKGKYVGGLGIFEKYTPHIGVTPLVLSREKALIAQLRESYTPGRLYTKPDDIMRVELEVKDFLNTCKYAQCPCLTQCCNPYRGGDMRML